MESICQEAHRLTNGERNSDYGHPLDDFDHAAAIISAILKIDIKGHQVPMIMFAVKIARESNKHKRDNLTDLAGYSNTLQMYHEEKQRRAALDELARISQEDGDYGTEATSTEDNNQLLPPGRQTVESSIRATNGH